MKHSDNFFTGQFSPGVTMDTSGLSVADVLVFFTGCDSLPPLGFNTCPKVVFCYNSTRATASTCDLIIRIPVLPDYEQFKAAMVSSLLDSRGFDQV
jgi:hypothetical protein